jgi:ABC-type dipeptide/oligopeptide/nickel transport system ATPase component
MKRETMKRMMMFWALLVALSLILTGCKTRQVVVATAHSTDTVVITKHQRDSIYMKDSTHVSEQQHGDTLLLRVTEWHTKFVDRAVHDTIRVATHDTIPQPVEVLREVPRQLSWWQRTRLTIANLILTALALFLGWRFVRFRFKL